VTFRFDSATQVRAISDGVFAASVHDGWDIGGNANGGYLLALVASALREATGRSLPVALSCHYLGPVNDADVTIETTVMKTGKAFTTALATMRQGDRIIVTALGTCGDALVTGAVEHTTLVMPQMPGFDKAVPRGSTSAGLPVRLHPDDTGFATGKPKGEAHVRGWCAFRDERPVDALALTLFCDALPPAMFNLSGAPGWVPTVQLSFYLRGVPDGAPVCAEFITRELHNGMFEEDGSIWNASGELVAQSRQLALLPR
jgi:hypothetical protein